MSIEFYDVKHRTKVSVPASRITKVKFVQSNGQVRYAFRGTTDDGRNLTKFCSKADWDASSAPEA